jgi:hypothetical protein
MPRRKVFERVYRMDRSAEFDWSQVCHRILAPGQGPPPKESVAKGTSDLHQLRVEYLLDVLKPLQYYSVDVPRSELNSEGVSVEVIQRKHFQLLAMTYGRSRPELMPTIESHQEVSVRSLLALSMQELSTKLSVDIAEGCACLPGFRRRMGRLERPRCFPSRPRVVAEFPHGQGIGIAFRVHFVIRFFSCSACACSDRYPMSSIGDALGALQ